MKGLIKKDLLMAKGNIKTMFIIIVVFALMAFNGEGSFAYIATYLCVVVMMSTFSYDEFNKSDAYILTLPKGKTNAVKAKYVATLILVVLASIFSVGIASISAIIAKDFNIINILSYSFGNLIGVMVAMSLFYPLIYKFGIEKSRIIIFVLVFFIVGGAAMLSHLGIKLSFITLPNNITKLLKNYMDIIILVISGITFVSSYSISKRIYSKKEF